MEGQQQHEGSRGGREDQQHGTEGEDESDKGPEVAKDKDTTKEKKKQKKPGSSAARMNNLMAVFGAIDDRVGDAMVHTRRAQGVVNGVKQRLHTAEELQAAQSALQEARAPLDERLIVDSPVLANLQGQFMVYELTGMSRPLVPEIQVSQAAGFFM